MLGLDSLFLNILGEQSYTLSPQILQNFTKLSESFVLLLKVGLSPSKEILFFFAFFFNWDSLHARSTKRLEHTGNQFRKNLQLKDVC